MINIINNCNHIILKYNGWCVSFWEVEKISQVNNIVVRATVGYALDAVFIKKNHFSFLQRC